MCPLPMSTGHLPRTYLYMCLCAYMRFSELFQTKVHTSRPFALYSFLKKGIFPHNHSLVIKSGEFHLGAVLFPSLWSIIQHCQFPQRWAFQRLPLRAPCSPRHTLRLATASPGAIVGTAPPSCSGSHNTDGFEKQPAIPRDGPNCACLLSHCAQIQVVRAGPAHHPHDAGTLRLPRQGARGRPAPS